MTHQPELIPDQPSAAPSSERDVDRGAYMDRLREYLQDPDFRAIEGFPIGEDEDILALSNPRTTLLARIPSYRRSSSVGRKSGRSCARS